MERREMNIHGHRVSYRTGGEGPVVLLIHGMAGSSAAWRPILEDLGTKVTYVAPDLPGHGKSDKPRGDYSLGAQASFLRDLMSALAHESATVVGTSLGGGIAMQYAYQYPERCERMVLVGAGGLGEDVTTLLRLLSLPGSEWVLPVATLPFIRTGVEKVTGWLSHIGLEPAAETEQVWSSYVSLIEPETRTAFLHTLRSVVDTKGQRVSAKDKLYLASDLPTLIVWGDEDPIIPLEHGLAAHEFIPGSRLEIMPGCGHFPYAQQPREFVEILHDFIDTTEAADIDPVELAQRLIDRGPTAVEPAGAGENTDPADPGDPDTDPAALEKA